MTTATSNSSSNYANITLPSSIEKSPKVKKAEEKISNYVGSKELLNSSSSYASLPIISAARPASLNLTSILKKENYSESKFKKTKAYKKYTLEKIAVKSANVVYVSFSEIAKNSAKFGVILADLNNGEWTEVVTTSNPITHLAFSENSNQLIYTIENSITVHNIKDNFLSSKALRDKINHLELTSSSVVLSTSQEIISFRLSDREKNFFPHGQDNITSLSYDQERGLLLTVCSASIKIWNSETLQLLKTIETEKLSLKNAILTQKDCILGQSATNKDVFLYSIKKKGGSEKGLTPTHEKTQETFFLAQQAKFKEGKLNVDCLFKKEEFIFSINPAQISVNDSSQLFLHSAYPIDQKEERKDFKEHFQNGNVSFYQLFASYITLHKFEAKAVED